MTDPNEALLLQARGASGGTGIALSNQDDGWSRNKILRSPTGRRAAAAATGNIISSFLENGTPSEMEKAAEVLAEISNEFGGDTPMSQAQPEIILPASVSSEPEPVVETPTDYELPADLAALLDEPEEFEDDDEPEPAVATVEEPDDDEYVDPQVAQLRRDLEKERRKTEHERKLRVQTARKDWEAEADRVFRLGDVPLLTPDELQSIKADSKRGFLRDAKALADRNKVIAQRFQPVAAPRVNKPDPEVVRAQEAARWGSPPNEGPTADAGSIGQQERLAKARRSGNLANIFKAQLFPEQE